MSATRRKGFLAAAAIAVSMGALLQAPPAAAAENLEPYCERLNVCLFPDVGYSGGIWQESGNNTNYFGDVMSRCQGSGYAWPLNHTLCGIDNRASAIDNDGGTCGSYHFLAADYIDSGLWLARGAARNYVGDRFNDNLSSHRWCG